MKKVLVIEDNEAVRENTAELLALSNYRVATAENGTTGFEQVKSCPPDVVLCDMMMPETDGLGFLQKIKNDPLHAGIPVVFFSAGTLPAEQQNKLARAANGFIKKPFTKEELLLAIETALGEASRIGPAAV